MDIVVNLRMYLAPEAYFHLSHPFLERRIQEASGITIG
jgi:hypothetical protein